MNKPFSRLIIFQYPTKGPTVSAVTRRHYSLPRTLNCPRTKPTSTPTKLYPLPPLRHQRCNWSTRQNHTYDAAPRVPRSARPQTLESSTSHSAVVLGLILAGFVAYWQLSQANSPSEPKPVPIEDATLVFNMAANQATGHVGNLSPEQEEKLRQFWHAIFGVCGLAEKSDKAEAATKEAAAAAEAEPAPKKRFGLFGRSKESPAQTSEPFKGAADGDDKFGLTKQFNEVLANHSPETIRETIWSMMKHDHPDALALRFLRARKWDVQKALIMLVSAMDWRHTEMKVDEDIMKNGEGGAVNEEKNGEGQAKKIGADFMAQLRMGKSFLHGVDKQNRPICIVRVRLHRHGDQCPESIERYTVHVIETARLALVSPVETATIIFDMTSFSLANMDYAPVKFMIKCFEANYPESLGSVLIHNAPWIFQGIWKIIKGWLDPVVAAKVHFTNGRAGLEEFIEPSRILKELGGDEDYDYKYIEPTEDENSAMKDTETRDKIILERGTIVKEIEQATLDWIREGDNEAGKAANAKRNEGAVRLRENYWKLDPYVRAKSLYDRQGVLGAAGHVQWYPAAEAEAKTNIDTAPVAAAPAATAATPVETTA